MGIVIGALIAFAGVLLAYEMLGDSNETTWSKATPNREKSETLRSMIGSKEAPITPLWPLLVEGNPWRGAKKVGSRGRSAQGRFLAQGSDVGSDDFSDDQDTKSDATLVRDYFGNSDSRPRRIEPDLDFGDLEDIEEMAANDRARQTPIRRVVRQRAKRADRQVAGLLFREATDTEAGISGSRQGLEQIDGGQESASDNQVSSAAIAKNYLLERAGYQAENVEETELEFITRDQGAREFEVVLPPQAYYAEEELPEELAKVVEQQQQVDDSVLAPVRRRFVRQPIGFSDRAFHQTVRGWKGTKACVIRVNRARQDHQLPTRSFELSMRIRPDGSVDSSESLTNIPGGHALTSCLERSSRQIRFPAFAGNQAVVRKAKFVF